VPKNTITISNPGALPRLLADMTNRHKTQDFINTYARLLNLISSHLETNKDRWADIWFADKQDTGSSWITWAIHDPAIEHPQRPGIVLAGVMHFHESDQTWSINT
jgi:hypothetical protein